MVGTPDLSATPDWIILPKGTIGVDEMGNIRHSMGNTWIEPVDTPPDRYGTSKLAEPPRGSRNDVDHPVNGNPSPQFQPQATPIVPAVGSPRQEDQVGPRPGSSVTAYGVYYKRIRTE